MNINTFTQYRDKIKVHTFQDNIPLDFRMYFDKAISIYYAPFDYVNTSAKIVICGITPGMTQALNAFREAKKQILLGKDETHVLRSAKETASFSGSMRVNLINMLDYIGANNKLGITSCEELFGSASDLVHYTSILRYPVFKNQKNYNGVPSMIKHPQLLKQILTQFVQETKILNQNTVYIPLGDKVAEGLEYLVKRRVIKETNVWRGMPHPSGANAERISYFLGKKDRRDLSYKTNPDKIDSEKEKLLKKVDLSILI